MVEFVGLLELENADQLAAGQLPGDEAELAADLEKQLQQRDKLDYLEDENYRSAVKDLSWTGVFRF